MTKRTIKNSLSKSLKIHKTEERKNLVKQFQIETIGIYGINDPHLTNSLSKSLNTQNRRKKNLVNNSNKDNRHL